MAEPCWCPNDEENGVCELPMRGEIHSPIHLVIACPLCGEKSKSVQVQTVKAMLSVSLMEVRDGTYLFCGTRACPVVYFSPDAGQSFTVEQIREKVYQKQPDLEETLICYCFQHNVGEFRTTSPKDRIAIVNDINQGIRARQCACDLRNPQGSCCLGNVNGLIKQIEMSDSKVTPRS